MFAFASRDGEQRVLLSTVSLAHTAVWTATGLSEYSFSLSSGMMLSEKGPSPTDGTTLQGTEGTRSFVTIRLPVRNQGDRISLCNILTVSLTAVIHKKKTFG